jgi:hypothetical protein
MRTVSYGQYVLNWCLGAIQISQQSIHPSSIYKRACGLRRCHQRRREFGVTAAAQVHPRVGVIQRRIALEGHRTATTTASCQPCNRNVSQVQLQAE